jgi:heat shock protein HslJ
MIRKLSTLLLAAMATIAVIAGGCSKAAANTSTPPSMPALSGKSLAGTSWNLVSYGDPAALTQVISGTRVTLQFNSDTTQISGNGGVNGFGGDCKRTDNQITFSQLIQTLMASADPAINAQENAYFALLAGAQSVSIGSGTLTINCEGGQVLNYTAVVNAAPMIPASTPAITSTGSATGATPSSTVHSIPVTPPTITASVTSTPANPPTVIITISATAFPPTSM